MLVRIPKIAYTIEEACVISSLSRATLFRSITAGELATVLDGRRRVVPREDLQAYLERKRVPAESPSA